MFRAVDFSSATIALDITKRAQASELVNVSHSHLPGKICYVSKESEGLLYKFLISQGDDVR